MQKKNDNVTQATATQYSDWDIAIRWEKQMNSFDALAETETLRHEVAAAVHNHADKIDLIDIVAARLAMRAVIAEEGITLKGENTLAWSHFLTHTWADLEDFYWRKQHAA